MEFDSIGDELAREWRDRQRAALPCAGDRPSRFGELAFSERGAAGELAFSTEYPHMPLTRWFVRMVVEGDAWRDAWKHHAYVDADCSSDAVGRARDDFYGTWATMKDRERMPLRVLEVSQVGV